MKKLFSYIILCFSLYSTKAQSHYEEVSGKFFAFYNAQSADSIYNLYSPELKEKLPPEKTTAVISGLHIQYGDLKSLKLIKEDSGFNRYKASFSVQTLTLLLSLNADDQIEGYRLVPYQP